MGGFFSRNPLVVVLALTTAVAGCALAAEGNEVAAAVVTDSTVYLAPQYLGFNPPAAGQTYVDPTFGSTIRRVSDALQQRGADTGNTLTFITHEYSTMSPFNSDNSRMIVIFQSYFALFDGNGNFVKDCPLEINASSEPRWSRSDPNVLYYVRGNQLKRYNAATNAIAVVHAFSEYSTINGKGESDICFDGNHFVFVGNNRYVFVYDLATGKKGRVLDTGGRGIDSVYITPKDNVTVTWLSVGNNRYNGIELFDRNMRFRRQLSPAGGHMDVTSDSNGDEVLVLTNAADPNPSCNNAVVKVRLSDGQKTCLVSLDWSLAVHISAPDRSGSVFVETYAPSDPTSTPAWTKYTNEILQVKLDGSEVRRLAHHRSRPFNSYNYQPRASVSRDGSRLLYSSNYGLQASLGYPTEYSDVYLLTVPASSGTGDTGGTGGEAAVVRTEETGAGLVYDGLWFKNATAPHSGGQAMMSMDTPSSVTFTFTGTGVRWIGYRDEWSGIATVSVDGGPVDSVDTYASPQIAQATMWSRTGLAPGTHTVKITVSGLKSSASQGLWIWIDAFDVLP